MFTVYDIIYFIIYGVCLAASFVKSANRISGFLYIRLILVFGLFTEIAASLFKYLRINDNTPYYFYIPAEYGLLMLFYASNTTKPSLKIALYSSIAVYLPLSIGLILFDHQYTGYPWLIYNISCLLNTLWVTILFFELVSVEDLPMTRLPLFWIYSALLIFYSGIFFFNGAYNYFLEKDSVLAKQLRNLINTSLNYILYALLTVGILCSKNIKKY